MLNLILKEVAMNNVKKKMMKKNPTSILDRVRSFLVVHLVNLHLPETFLWQEQ